MDFLFQSEFYHSSYPTDPMTPISPESVELLLQYYLQMDGRGSVQFKPIESDTEEFGS